MQKPEYNIEDIDVECRAVVDTLNRLPGIATDSCCCGHYKEPYSVWFFCDDFITLGRLYRCVDRNYSDGKFVIEVSCSDTAPTHGFVLKSKNVFDNETELNESVDLLMENIQYWFQEKFDEYFNSVRL